MHQLIWYRQQRVDGGVRTAVAVDETTLLHRFENRSEEPDPALLWYVDLRCRGAGLPTDAEGARGWLLENAAVIRVAFGKVADEFEAGADVGAWPVQRNVRGFPGRVKASVVFSAARRLDLLRVAAILADIAGRWEELVRALTPVESTPPARRR